MLRYYIVLISVGGYSVEVRKKLTHKYVGSLAQITCEMTCHPSKRYRISEIPALRGQ